MKSGEWSLESRVWRVMESGVEMEWRVQCGKWEMKSGVESAVERVEREWMEWKVEMESGEWRLWSGECGECGE